MYVPAVLCWERTVGRGCCRRSIVNYKTRGFPRVWNGIVHSLCHISACLTRQNKSFSIFQCSGTDKSEQTWLLYCCSASSCLVLSYLVSSLLPSSEVLSSPLRLHHTEKRPLKAPKSPCQTNLDTMKPTRIDSQPSFLSIYYFSICPIPQATLASVLSPLKLPPLGFNTCTKMSG